MPSSKIYFSIATFLHSTSLSVDDKKVLSDSFQLCASDKPKSLLTPEALRNAILTPRRAGDDEHIAILGGKLYRKDAPPDLILDRDDWSEMYRFVCSNFLLLKQNPG